MQVALIFILIIAAGALVAAVLGFFQRGGTVGEKPVAADCASCATPGNPKCEQVCQLEAAVKPVEYYDDEELDAYRGRASDSYTDSEAGEFENIMLTMRPDEVSGWSRSLVLRGINVPNQIKDELIAIIQDNR